MGIRFNNDYVWVDTETTGLPDENPEHRVTEICVILTDAELNVKAEFETKIALDARGQELFPPELRAKMGYSDAEWAGAPPESKELWRNLLRLTEGATWSGQNPSFDITMVTNALTRVGLTYFNKREGKVVPDTNWQRRVYDTTTFCHSIMRDFDVRNDKGHPSASLQDIYPVLGLPELPKHRARSDLLKCMALYRIYVLEGYPQWKRRRRDEILATRETSPPEAVPV